MTRRDPYVLREPAPGAEPIWRSLEDKADPPRAQKRAAAESNDPTGFVSADALLGRRGFLTVSGATAAAVGLSGCMRRPVENILPYARQPEYVVPGIPLHFATVTDRLGDAIGLLVESHEGRPTKIEGNPEHPASQGATDLWAQASVLDLYDPDRSERVAKAGEGGGELADAGETVAEAYAAFDEALGARHAEHRRDGGTGLALLVQPTTSPSFLRVRRAVQARFPNARIHTWSPVNQSNAREGTRAAFGQLANVHYDFAGAQVILALDSDFLQTESGAVRNQRAFANGRRLESPSSAMNRLYVVEPAYTVTGANADHRLRLPARDVSRYLRALAAELATRHGVDFGAAVTDALGSPSRDGIPEPWVTVVAAELAQSRGRNVVVAGARQPTAVHALVHALNRALGNVGTTVGLTPAADSEERDQASDIRALVESMTGGDVRTLLILGGNPVYDAPADLAFADALDRVEVSVHLSSHRDETSLRCSWHVPRAHELEAWGDLRALDGTVSVQQPLIAPLFGGRSDLEMLAIVAGERNWRGHSVVRRTLRDAMGQGAGFERAWRRALHAGVVAGTQVAPSADLAVDLSSVATALRDHRDAEGALGPDNFEVTFAPCPKVLDGRYANNTWLLELPEPTTKIAWDNCATISPATARELGVESGQMLRLSREGAGEIDVAAWVMPGQADWSIGLTLGWGRAHAGQYGRGRGFDVYPLRTSTTLGFTERVTVRPGEAGYLLAQTQEHASMEGRAVAIHGTLEDYRAEPEFPKYQTVEMDIPPLWDTVDYSEGHKWGMSIDLTTCTGCNACVIACQAENNIPSVGKRQVARGREMHWLRIDRYFVGEDEADPRVVMQPVACVQCEEAPCENVCPVNATTHSPEGLNDMAYNRCIGTRYCSNNCPYKVRRFNYFTWHGYLEGDAALGGDYYGVPETKRMQFNPNVTVRMRGVMEKCTYCVQRIQEARIARRREHAEYRDGDVVTACQQSCPSNAIVFGDLNDPQSGVSRLRARDRAYLLLAEVGTRPRTTHMASIRNPNPEMLG
jgi:molybdopterin-containing oxidoreductase family iron-sulfur binding subunit